ncbi:hypothetical protein MRX96_012339 [Rhipicephalus microplus]
MDEQARKEGRALGSEARVTGSAGVRQLRPSCTGFREASGKEGGTAAARSRPPQDSFLYGSILSLCASKRKRTHIENRKEGEKMRERSIATLAETTKIRQPKRGPVREHSCVPDP